MGPRSELQCTILCVRNRSKFYGVRVRDSRGLAYEWKRSDIERTDGFEYPWWNVEHITGVVHNRIDFDRTIEFLVGTSEERTDRSVPRKQTRLHDYLLYRRTSGVQI